MRADIESPGMTDKRDDPHLNPHRRLLASSIVGIVVFIVGFAIHQQLVLSTALAPFASHVSDGWVIIPWINVIWGGWPLVIALASSALVASTVPTYWQSFVSSTVVVVVAAFIAASFASAQVAGGGLGAIAFYFPFYATIGVAFQVLVSVVLLFRRRRSE